MFKRILIVSIVLILSIPVSALDIPDFFKGKWIDSLNGIQYNVADSIFLIGEALLNDEHIVSENYSAKEIENVSGNIELEEAYMLYCTDGTVFIFSTQGEDIYILVMVPMYDNIMVPVHVSVLMRPKKLFDIIEKEMRKIEKMPKTPTAEARVI